MKSIVFWFDFVSPYAYLAFEGLPRALEGLSHSVEYRPVLFAGLLKAHGQKGPAEIAGKRDWTYRQIAWMAHTHGIRLDLPAVHPFNPLPLLRLALAAGDGTGAGEGACNRWVAETIFRHVWQGGRDPTDPARLAKLREQIAPRRDPESEAVKAELKAQTERALAQGLFGVPTMQAMGRDLWGFDALPMLRAALQSDPWFDGPAWDAAARLPVGASRKP